MHQKLNWINAKFLFKISIAAGILIYLGFKVDLSKIKAILTSIDILFFLLSYGVFLLSAIPLAARLKTLLEPTALQFTIPRLIEIQFICQFYSLLFPSGVGMSIVRWYKITQNRKGRSIFLIITIIERVMLIFTLMVCIGLPLVFVDDLAIIKIRLPILMVILPSLAICLCFFCFLSIPAIYNQTAKWLRSISGKKNTRLKKNILQFVGDMGIYSNRRHLLFKAFLYHLVFQAIIFVRFYFVFVSMQLKLPPVTILWVSMLILLVLSLPISIGGIGVREAGFSVLLSLYGISPEQGVLLGGLVTLQVLISVLLGAVLSLFESRHIQADNR